MSANLENREQWTSDIKKSVDFYNDWYFRFAPENYRSSRKERTERVAEALRLTSNLRNITPEVLRENPRILPVLRMTTSPPIARDRLVGLAGVGKTLVGSMEGYGGMSPRIPPKIEEGELLSELSSMVNTISRLLDKDIFFWLDLSGEGEASEDVSRAATIVADRLAGSETDPIIRNEQERRQFAAIQGWLVSEGYTLLSADSRKQSVALDPGTFTFRLTAKGKKKDEKQINIPIDVIIMPKRSNKGELPLFVEAKSAGDYTNVNKRRKEEVGKLENLKRSYGQSVKFVLFLCGYFDQGYLDYAAAENIDWVWEHRLDDLSLLGL